MPDNIMRPYLKAIDQCTKYFLRLNGISTSNNIRAKVGDLFKFGYFHFAAKAWHTKIFKTVFQRVRDRTLDLLIKIFN